MDSEMTKRFHETFIQIRSQFNDVFRSLFGGGRAELKLTDPNDLLNSGVDIIAQPPGKTAKLKSFVRGERALTAIALLFSILKVRPVPFCVLDEVEAALDEANVFRFAQYLKIQRRQPVYRHHPQKRHHGRSGCPLRCYDAGIRRFPNGFGQTGRNKRIRSVTRKEVER